MGASKPLSSASVRDYRNPSSYNGFEKLSVYLILIHAQIIKLIAILENFVQQIGSEGLQNHVPEPTRAWMKVNSSTGEMDDEVRLVTLPRGCYKFSILERRIHKTLNIHVDKIQQIQNPYLYRQYLVKGKEYKKRLNKSVKEMKLFHATGQDNVQSIAENNFDWRLTERNKFGKGVSFSPFADYADKHCNRKAGNRRALIVTRVLVGRAHKGYYNCQSPKEGFDTTTGNNGAVLVKYCDHEFYPEYVVYYSKQE